MSKKNLLLIFLFVLFNVRNVNAQVSSNLIISPENYQKMLGHGLDVDWWSRNSEKKYGEYSDKAIENFAQKKIGHVRIRIHHYDLSEKDFERLNNQVEACLRNSVIPIIAFSAKPYKKQPDSEAHRKVVDWWQRMAEYFRYTSPLLSFDLIIEPSDHIKKNTDELSSLYEDCVSVIRETNPHRIIFIAPNKLSNPQGLKDLKIPSKGNGYIMAEWHFYASGPDKKNPKKLWTIGTIDEKELILEKIKSAVIWQEQTGIYTWVGAWMPGNYNKGNDYTPEEQIAFSKFMKEVLDENQIPFAINSDKIFYDYSNDTWRQNMEKLLQTLFQ